MGGMATLPKLQRRQALAESLGALPLRELCTIVCAMNTSTNLLYSNWQELNSAMLQTMIDQQCILATLLDERS